MKPRARMFGHPIHRILVTFPLGLLATSFFFDLAWLATGREQLGTTAHMIIFAGILGGVLASIFGLLDWLSIPRGTRARAIGAVHGAGNAVVTMVFAWSWFLRRDLPQHPSGGEIALSALGVLLIVATAFLGSEVAARMEDTE